MRKVKTTCAYCGVGCGIEAEVTGPRSVTIAGDEDHPANAGRLCSKGTWLSETVGLEGRLLHPMIGERRVGWSHALDEVADRLRSTIEEHGPDAVAFYVSGQLLTEDYYVANKLLKGFVGTANIDTNSRLCMASAVAAHNRAFGEDVVPCTYEDLDHSDLILLIGSNTAWCHPVIWQRIEQARERRGTKLVVIDPRRTETAEQADLHIAIEPDGDTALFNALLAEMRDRDMLDRGFIAERCVDPADFIDDLDARAHGIDPAAFDALSHRVAENSRMITLFSQGANQSVYGTDKGNAIINLHLATGRIGKEGAGPFSMTGQPNAMGGREVGGLANTLACHLGFSEAERADVAHFWNAPDLCAGPGLKAVDLFRAIHDGRIRFIWIMGTNPAVSMPDAAFVREALRRCPNVIVSEVIAETDTARLADIRLPALAWGEKDGTVTNSERRVSRQRALFAAPGETRADWQIMCEVADRLGHGGSFAYTDPSQIFCELARMTSISLRHGKMLDLTIAAGLCLSDYDSMRPFLWGGKHPTAQRFAHPDGRARIVSIKAPAAAARDPAFPLRLNTGRYRDQWHTMTRTGLSAKLSRHRREPLLEVHPRDALAAGLKEGGIARVLTAQGSAQYRVSFCEGQRPGDIFVPMHWTDLTGSSRTGTLVHPKTDPVSGQPGFKNVPAAVEPFATNWQAFLVSRQPVAPASAYWARVPIDGGWLAELAGTGAIDCDALLPAGERSDVEDTRRGMRRVMVHDPCGQLLAALYVTRDGTLPDRDWVERQFADQNAGMVELLAGRPSSPLPDRGKLVCLCFDVDEHQVREAVRSGAGNLKAASAATRAGTNCGSCRPLLARIVEQAQQFEAEAAE